MSFPRTALASICIAVTGCASAPPPAATPPHHDGPDSAQRLRDARAHPVATPEPRTRLPEQAPPEALTAAETTPLPPQWQLPSSGSDVHGYRAPAPPPRHVHPYRAAYAYEPDYGPVLVADLAFLAFLTAAFGAHHGHHGHHHGHHRGHW